VTVVNELAPEHCEIHARQAGKLAGRIVTAGAVFIGPWSPTVLGDYVAGPSHTLPTGAGRSFAGLTMDQFQRRTSVIEYTKASLKRAARVRTFAARRSRRPRSIGGDSDRFLRPLRRPLTPRMSLPSRAVPIPVGWYSRGSAICARMCRGAARHPTADRSTRTRTCTRPRPACCGPSGRRPTGGCGFTSIPPPTVCGWSWRSSMPASRPI
jgi:hypothetical protein